MVSSILRRRRVILGTTITCWRAPCGLRLWAELTAFRGDNVYVTSNTNYVAVRWQTHAYSYDYGSYLPVNFEAVLYPNGNVEFNYAEAANWVYPTVGVSAGDYTHCTLSAYDNAYSVPANTSSLMTAPQTLPPGLSLSPAGVLSGTPTVAGGYDFNVTLTDSASPPHTVTTVLHMNVSNLPLVGLTLPSDVIEGMGIAAGAVTIPTALPNDLTVNLSAVASTPIPEEQRVAFTPAANDEQINSMQYPQSREFTLVIDGQTYTPDMSYDPTGSSFTADRPVPYSAIVASMDSTAAQMQTALESLATVNPALAGTPGDISVTWVDGTSDPSTPVPGGYFDVVFDGQWAGIHHTITKGIHRPNRRPPAPGQSPLPNFMYYGAISAITTIEGLDQDSRLSLPASVTIPAGRLSAPLPITIPSDEGVGWAETVSITASADGFNNGVDTITVHDRPRRRR